MESNVQICTTMSGAKKGNLEVVQDVWQGSGMYTGVQ